MSNAHIRYAVRTPDGFLGARRFDYGKGSHSLDTAAFKHARLFTRKGDATQACNYNGRGEVVQIYIDILDEMPVP